MRWGNGWFGVVVVVLWLWLRDRRGPIVLQDFALIDYLAHFDRERYIRAAEIIEQ